MSNKTWSGVFKVNSKSCLQGRARATAANVVFVVGALLFAYPAAMAQDIVQSGQESPARAAPGANGGNPFSNRFLITFSPGTSHAHRAEIAAQAGAFVRHNFNLANAATVIVPSEGALNALRNNRSVATVSPEGVLHLFAKKPAAPTNLIAGLNGSNVDLSWSDNSIGNGQEGGFEIQRCTGVGCGDFAWLSTTLPDATDYIDVAPGDGNHSYRVRATNSGNGASSQWSNIDTVVVGDPPPAAPTNLSALLNDPDVDLTWADNSSGPGQEGGFEIERCTGVSCGDFGQIFVTTPDVTVYNDPGAGSHGYRVRATNAAAGPASDWSNIEVVVIGSSLPPAAPTGLAAGSTFRYFG